MTRNQSTILDFMRIHADNHPDKVAVRFLGDGLREAGRLTYGELDAQARQLASALLERAKPGSRAALVYPSCLDFITTLVGCWYAGIAPAPVPAVPSRRGIERIRTIVGDLRPAMVLGRSTEIDSLRQASSETTAWPWVETDRMETRSAGMRSDPKGSGVAIVQYTSGSTTSPKGILISHRNLLENEYMIREAFGHDERSSLLSWLPIHHDMGLVGGLLQPLFLGSTTTLMSPESFLARPISWLEAISLFKPHTSGGPNFAYEMCVEAVAHDDTPPLDLRSWRVAFNGAEPVKSSTLERFSARFESTGFSLKSWFPCYGLAEATLFVAGSQKPAPVHLSVDREEIKNTGKVVAPQVGRAEYRYVSCGQPARGIDLCILHPADRRPVKENMVGEICLRGPNVADGVVDHFQEATGPLKSQPRRRRGGYLHTGDLGFIRGGDLYVTGRLGDLIIIRGVNIHPEDVEASLDNVLPPGSTSGRVAFPTERNGEETLTVVVECSEKVSTDERASLLRAIRSAVNERIGVDPQNIALVPRRSLLKTTSGKICRSACREAFESSQWEVLASTIDLTKPSFESSRERSPSTADSDRVHQDAPSEQEIAQFLRECIIDACPAQASLVDFDTPFTSMGIDSKRVVVLAAQLSSRLGRTIPPISLYRHGTIAELSRVLQSHRLHENSSPTLVSDSRREPIAILGVGCHFPASGEGPDAFWEFLNGNLMPKTNFAPPWRTTSHPVPPVHLFDSRSLNRFDADFFGISEAESQGMDPAQQMLLEVSWQALEDAGLEPRILRERSIGIFLGVGNQEVGSPLRSNAEDGYGNPFELTARSCAMAAGRLSYFLGTRGPCMVVDTACSSSLAAIHLARQAIRQGDCELALAGGVNRIYSDHASRCLNNMGLLSPTGKSKPFDTSADGYVRGEGCGIVVLSKSPNSPEGARPRAWIRATGMNHNGRSNGLLAPNPAAQEDLFRRTLAQASLDPSCIDFVEAHGTATALGDLLEADTLQRVIGENRPANRPAWVGSVKGGLGHLEFAAGIAGLIKGILSLERRRWPAQPEAPKPIPSLIDGPVRLAVNPIDWSEGESPKRASVSSFGISGTNVVAIIEEASTEVVTQDRHSDHPWLIVIRARTESDVRWLARQFHQRLSSLSEEDARSYCAAINARFARQGSHLVLVAGERHDLLLKLARVEHEPMNGRRHAVAGPPRFELADIDACSEENWTLLVGVFGGLHEKFVAFHKTPPEKVATPVSPRFNGKLKRYIHHCRLLAIMDFCIDWIPAWRTDRQRLLRNVCESRLSSNSTKTLENRIPFGVIKPQALLELLATLDEQGVEIDWRALSGTLLRSSRRCSPAPMPFHATADSRSQEEHLTRETKLDAPIGTSIDESGIVKEIAKLFAHSWGVEEESIPLDETIENLGVDSVLIVAALRRIQMQFGRTISIREALQGSPTIRELAALLANAHRASPAGSHQASDGGSFHKRLPSEKPPLPRKTVANQAAEPNDRQRAYFQGFASNFVSRTARSRRVSQRYRKVLADNRVSAGFRPSSKSIVYPLVARRGRDAHLIDIDGNDYVDLTMGFGVHFFGHNPSFISTVVRRAFERGWCLGPHTSLAGRAARLMAKITGHERVAFCNTGTEAVMTAIRLARAVSRKDTIVVFEGCYHGHSDGMLADQGEGCTSIPAVLGVPTASVAETMVLPFGATSSLDEIARHSARIGAVLIEPVPSRHPERASNKFLQDLRRVTEEHRIALIFDEMITGFRVHPAGVQGYFGIRADMGTYGKILGGGFPIGAIAGASRYMDAIDGGFWSFDDDSVPSAETTFVAGTFTKHPLTMAAVLAVLRRMKKDGHALCVEVNRKTEVLVQRLNQLCLDFDAPLRIESFGSLFRFRSSRLGDVFYHHLVHHGAFIWEGRTCFLSESHTSDDIDRIVEAFRLTMIDLRNGGHLSASSPSPPSLVSPATVQRHVTPSLPLLPRQIEILESCSRSIQGECEHHEYAILSVRGPLNHLELREAISSAIKDGDIISWRLDEKTRCQRWLENADANDPPLRLMRGVSKLKMDRFIRKPFSLDVEPPIRFALCRESQERSKLLAVSHPIFIDGVSLGILLERILTLLSMPIPLPSEHLNARTNWLETVERELEELPSCSATHRRRIPKGFAPACLGLPLDGAEDEHRGYRRYSRRLMGAGHRVRDAARHGNLKVLTILLMSFGETIVRRSGCPEVILPIWSTGRSEATSLVIGTFSRLVPAPYRATTVRDASLASGFESVLYAALRNTSKSDPWHPMTTWFNDRLAQNRGFVTFNLDPASMIEECGSLRLAREEVGVCKWGRTPLTTLHSAWNVTLVDSDIQIDVEVDARHVNSYPIKQWIREYEEELRGHMSELTYG